MATPPKKTQVSMKVNGADVDGLVEPRLLLVHFLRENLQLTGTHIGCETTHCGACTVDCNGMSVKSCTMFAVQADGSDITTIEGMANPDGTLWSVPMSASSCSRDGCVSSSPTITMGSSSEPSAG